MKLNLTLFRTKNLSEINVKSHEAGYVWVWRVLRLQCRYPSACDSWQVAVQLLLLSALTFSDLHLRITNCVSRVHVLSGAAFSRRRSEHTHRNVELKPTVLFRTTPTHNSWEIATTWCYRKPVHIARTL